MKKHWEQAAKSDKKSASGKKPEAKRKKAVALKYDPTMTAPSVVAKGSGLIAEKILDKAKDIPVYEDAKLAEELLNIDVASNIPPELYGVVAQVLLFISDLDKYRDYR